MGNFASVTSLSDSALLIETSRLASSERSSTAQLIAALREVDARRLYLGLGYSSMFMYCTQALHLSEQAAYSRIEVARASRAFPQLVEELTTGSLTLTTAVLLAPHLTRDNVSTLLERATFKTRREVEKLIAEVHPMPDVPDAVRKEVVAPLAPDRYRIQFTADQETHDKLRYAQALLRHQIVDGDICAIVGKALTLLIADVERRKLGMARRPRAGAPALAAGSRKVPAHVRREVWVRDDGRCAFLGPAGRCAERGRLEYHHVKPFAAGGPATPANIELRCRAHNGHEALIYFGREADQG